MAPPTRDNLATYRRQELTEDDSSEYEDVFEVTVGEGETLFIPSGWLRASKVLENAITLHGSFLHSFGAVDQISVAEMIEELEVRATCRSKLPNNVPVIEDGDQRSQRLRVPEWSVR
jgi:hypothetical protein